MPSTNNLASYFSTAGNNCSASNSNSAVSSSTNTKNKNDSQYSSTLTIFGIDPSQSNAVHAQDNESFQKSSYKLKRTRSMGLLDHYIAPTKKLIEEDFSHTNHFKNDPLGINNNSSSYSSNHKSLSSKNLDQLNLDLSSSPAATNGNSKNNATTYSSSTCSSPSICSFTFQSSDLKSPNTIKSKPTSTASCDNNTITANNASSFSMSSAESLPSVYSTDNSISNNISASPAITGEILQPHDDTDIIFEPKNRVDYFSYDWTDTELFRSWRYIVDQKKSVDTAERVENSRLENASWRTWARAKYCLKTVTPESINWKKDKDVSWLYGPKCNPETESDALNNLRENKIRITNNSSNESNTVTSTISNDLYNQDHHQHENTLPHGYNDIIMSSLSVNTSSSSIPLPHPSNLPAFQSSQVEDPTSSTVIPMSTSSTDSIATPQYVKPILKQRKISEKINAHSELFKLNISQERKIKQQQSLNSPTLVANSNGNSPVVGGSADNELQRVVSPMALESSSLELPSSAMDIDQYPSGRQDYFAPDVNYSDEDNGDACDEESKKKIENKKLLKSSFLVVPTNQDESAAKRSRRIHFNDRVEQCKIIDYYSDSEEEKEYFDNENSSNKNWMDEGKYTGYDDDVDDEADYEGDEDEEDEDDGLMFSTRGPSSQQSLLIRQLSRTSSTHSSSAFPFQPHSFSQFPKIIEPIPATKIRFRCDEPSSEEESDFESEDEDNYQWLLKNSNAIYNGNSKGSNSMNAQINEDYGSGDVLVGNNSVSSITSNNTSNGSGNNNNNSSGRRNDFYDYNTVYMPENLPLNENYRNDMNAYYNNIAKSYMNSAAHTNNNTTTPNSSTKNNAMPIVQDDDDDDDIEMEDVPQSIAMDLQNQDLDDSINASGNDGELLSRNPPSSAIKFNFSNNSRTNSFNHSMNNLAISNDYNASSMNRVHSSFLTKKPSSAKNLSSTHFGASSLTSFAQHIPVASKTQSFLKDTGIKTTNLNNLTTSSPATAIDGNANHDGAGSSLSRKSSGLLRSDSKPRFSLLDDSDGSSSDEEIKDVPQEMMMPSQLSQHSFQNSEMCPVRFVSNKSGFSLADVDDDAEDDNYDSGSDDDDGNIFNFSHANHRENISSATLSCDNQNK